MNLKFLNLALRFLLELCMLAALAYWGYHAGDGLLMQLVLAVGAPLVAAVIWGLFIAPRASRRLADPARLLLELVLWVAAAVGLAAAGQPTLAAIFAVVVAVNLVLGMVWGQRNIA